MLLFEYPFLSYEKRKALTIDNLLKYCCICTNTSVFSLCFYFSFLCLFRVWVCCFFVCLFVVVVFGGRGVCVFLLLFFGGNVSLFLLFFNEMG